ncbi:hypothetical protein CHLRE_12g560800v5 [Chlamydomonas reinhardtii]|uniref:Peptidase M20 dimerisation domain-containing protein n=1 Tax=Chlamydomonas reinhardtii TaxID=3055 RepID=A0A2K3D5H2_CHLRE|nr:uncharacterized protein CHLRE_12g560800v5 [Chlamydomonas reinhardtii]PNW75781.1 hypothetical protein CHLRE_12g560800v5 [Chlamydomonas reinhardtii]
MGTNYLLPLAAYFLACCVAAQPSLDFTSILADARGGLEDVRRWRRDLHMMPELSFQEHNTSAYIRAQLDALGIPYTYPLGVTGIRAVLSGAGGDAGPTVALRADIDGLPITEEHADLPYTSRTPGRMHACGHDSHAAMLLGAAKLLKARESQLPGRVVLLFQPAEEGLGGARALIRDGAVADVEAIHGLHVLPDLPSGIIGTRPGTIMAASDRFEFVVRGLGGHGALPHTTRDPVVAAAAVVTALQTLVSRETSPVDAAVVTVSRFNTGPGAANVIPESVELQGTVRALTQATFERLHRRLEEVAAGVAAAYGCSVTNVSWSEVPYPPTVNEARMVELVLDVAAELLGSEAEAEVTAAGGTATGAGGGGDSTQRVRVIEPLLAAEDFSFYGGVVPQAAFTFLGIGDPAKGTNAGLHTPRFQVDEEQMPLGAALHAAVAVRWLQDRAAAAAQVEAEVRKKAAKATGSAGHEDL